MAVDIFSIKPSVISRDLKGKYVLLYGKPKSGKTTAATQFPKSLLCAFEKGYNAIGGVMAQDITKWSEFKQVVKQLERPEAHDLFETVVIDTVSIAYELCEKHICQQNGVSKISDVAWGGGFSACKKEFEATLRRIAQLNFGIVLICHSATRIEKSADGSDIEIISPELPKRAAEICNGLVDVLGYIGNEYKDGEIKRYLYTRETPTLFAGSRFKYLAPKIPFGYQELVDAIAEAIDKAEKLDGAVVVDKMNTIQEVTLNFNEIYDHAREVWTQLIQKAGDDEELQQRTLREINKKIELVFGRKIKLSEVTEDQVDLLNLAVMDLETML